MAYVAPNSIIELFGDVGLSDNYTDTYYFASETGANGKDAYFTALPKVGVSLTPLSYLREERNQVKVQLPMSQIYSARYMRFKNTSFENKWFYAFIKNIEYINNECSCIHYELDPMMTWMGKFTLGECFIERQHTLRDGIGENICDEKLDTGEYVCEHRSTTAFFGEYALALYRSQTDTEHVNPDVRQGTFIPLVATYYQMTTAGITNLQNKIEELIGDNRADEILTIKLVPYRWCAQLDATVATDVFTVEKPYNGSPAWGNFIPNNKKLYTFPYKYLSVTNCEDSEVPFKYEYFNDLPDEISTGDCTFNIRGSAGTPEINIMCYATDYNGFDFDYEHAVTMSDFPTVAWNVDGYKAYLAQRDSTLFSNIVSNGITGAVSGALFGGAGAVIGGASGMLSGAKPLIQDTAYNILNMLTGDNLPARVPNETRGKMSSNLMAQMRNKNFYFNEMCITKNYAMMIDSYFDMFGYAVRQHGVPNMNARPHWTYVKTVGCQVDGAVPADDASFIENIFNNGIRFWNKNDTIGDYSKNNAPATP